MSAFKPKQTGDTTLLLFAHHSIQIRLCSFSHITLFKSDHHANCTLAVNVEILQCFDMIYDDNDKRSGLPRGMQNPVRKRAPYNSRNPKLLTLTWQNPWWKTRTVPADITPSLVCHCHSWGSGFRSVPGSQPHTRCRPCNRLRCRVCLPR
jgi:hypothetical protein